MKYSLLAAALLGFPGLLHAAPASPEETASEKRVEWWREARFGMFIHWGLYAIPAGVWKDKVHASGYSEWLMYSEKIPAKEYAQLANQFNPVKFDAKAWMNVGPTAEGLIPQPCIDRLAEVGEWMKVSQEAIYGTMPWKVSHEVASSGVGTDGSTDIRFTSKGDSVYAICLAAADKELVVKSMGKKEIGSRTIASAKILGSKEEVKWQQDDADLTLPVPPQKPSPYAFVYRIDFDKLPLKTTP
jgi:hypothetical protein